MCVLSIRKFSLIPLKITESMKDKEAEADSFDFETVNCDRTFVFIAVSEKCSNVGFLFLNEKYFLANLAYSIQEKLNLCVSVSYIILGWNSLSYHKREQAVQRI